MTSPYLTVQEAADVAHCEHRTIRRAIKNGALPASYGGRWLVAEEDVHAWLWARAEERLATPESQRRPRARPRRENAGRPGSVADLKEIRERLVSN